MRRQRRRIFVGCEGEGERSYIALVQRIVDGLHHQVHLDAHPLQPGGGDPLDLARRAEAVIKKIERTREPYDEKNLLIDRDTLGNSPQRDREARAILNRMDARVLWQDPTHEALILRHLPGCRARGSRCASFGSNGPNTRSRCQRYSLRAAPVSKACAKLRAWRTTYASCLPLSGFSSAARFSAQGTTQGCEAKIGSTTAI